MSKRRHRVDLTSDGTHKKRKPNAGQQKPTSVQKAKALDSAQHKSQTTAPATNVTTALPVNTETSRKRQRKRAKRRLLKAQHRRHAEAPPDSKQAATQETDQWPHDVANAYAGLPSTDRELFQRVSCTFLMQRPVKQWQDTGGTCQGPVENSAQGNVVSKKNASQAFTTATNGTPHVKVPVTKGYNVSPSASVASQTTRSANTSTMPRSLDVSTRSEDISFGESSISAIEDTQPSGNDKEVALDSTVAPILSPSPESHVHTGLRRFHLDFDGIGKKRKSLNAMKASTVPSYSSNSDIHGAFKRFDDFANGRDGSETDDNSEESEDSGSEDEQLTEMATTTEQFALPAGSPEAGDEPSESVRQPILTNNTDEIISALNARNPEDAALEDGSVALLEDEAPAIDEDGEDGEDDEDDEDGGVAIDARCIQTESNAEIFTEQAVEELTSHLPPDSAQLVGDMIRSQSAETRVSHPVTPLPEDGPSIDDLATPDEQLPRSRQPQKQAFQTRRAQVETDLPLFSTLTAATTPNGTEKTPGKSVPFLDRHHGGKNLDSGLNSIPVETDQEDRQDYSHFDDTGRIPDREDDDMEDGLFRSIEDISTEVFGSTCGLPFGKPLRDLHIQEKLALTDTLSNGRIDSVSPSRRGLVRVYSPIVYICDVPGYDTTNVAMPEVPVEESDEDQQEIKSKSEVGQEEQRSSSPLSQLDYSPTPPSELRKALADAATADEHSKDTSPTKKKRKMTGMTSKHWSPSKRTPLAKRVKGVSDAAQIATSQDVQSSPTVYVTPDTQAITSAKRKRSTRKSTAKESQFFTPAESPSKQPDAGDTATPVPRKRRVPAGTSASPVPPTTQQYFGLIQEKLWDQPFWLIIAVTFLNKTAGKAAAPIFWSLKEKYPTPEALAEADIDELVDMIYHLGLQTQRAKRLVSIAKVWSKKPPEKAQRYRTLHYPVKQAGKEYQPTQVVEEDAIDCGGALEIGHIPGCGPYAWDSWRIFCRDVLRVVAKDFNGESAGIAFEPEWQRVLPLDKELRACLRWMWLREGWVWNCETGEKRVATEEEVEKGKIGEMEIQDASERKFAEQAAGDGENEKADPMIEAAATEELSDANDSADEIVVKRKETTKTAESRKRRSSRRSEWVSLPVDR